MKTFYYRYRVSEDPEPRSGYLFADRKQHARKAVQYIMADDKATGPLEEFYEVKDCAQTPEEAGH